MRNEYKHTYWLKMEDDMTEKAWTNLKEYKEKYDCNIEVFYRLSNFINKFIKLECNQSYQDLDLDVNSASESSLIRMSRKPKDIKKYNQPIEEFFGRYIKSKVDKPRELSTGIFEIIPIHNVTEGLGEIYSEYMNLNVNNGTVIYEKRLGFLTQCPDIIKISEYQQIINKNGIKNIGGAKEFIKFIHKYPNIYIEGINNEEKSEKINEEEYAIQE